MDILEGIVIKTMDYKENSKIVFIVTKFGMKSYEVAGANKITSKVRKFANVISKITFKDTKHYLSGYEVLGNYPNIKGNMFRISIALEIVDLVYSFADHITDKKLFYDFLSKILDKISSSSNFKFYYLVFKAKLLYLLGIAPIFSKCVECSDKDNIAGFVIEKGGSICFNCLSQEDYIYDKKVIKEIKLMYLSKMEKIESLNYNQYDFEKDNIFLDRYITHFFGSIKKSVIISDDYFK